MGLESYSSRKEFSSHFYLREWLARSKNSLATITRMCISSLEGQYFSKQGSVLYKMINVFSLLGAHVSSYLILKTGHQENFSHQFNTGFFMSFIPCMLHLYNRVYSSSLSVAVTNKNKSKFGGKGLFHLTTLHHWSK